MTDRQTGRTTAMLDAAKPGDRVVMFNATACRRWKSKYPHLEFRSFQSLSEAWRGSTAPIHIDHACFERGGPHLYGYVQLQDACRAFTPAAPPTLPEPGTSTRAPS